MINFNCKGTCNFHLILNIIDIGCEFYLISSLGIICGVWSINLKSIISLTILCQNVINRTLSVYFDIYINLVVLTLGISIYREFIIVSIECEGMGVNCWIYCYLLDILNWLTNLISSIIILKYISHILEIWNIHIESFLSQIWGYFE